MRAWRDVCEAHDSPSRQHAGAAPPLDDGDAALLEAYGEFDGLRFADVDLSGLDLSHCAFRECSFESVSMDGADLRGTALVECRLQRLDAPVFPAPRSRFDDVVIEGARLGSAELYDASVTSLHLVGCRIGYLNLRGARLLDVSLTDCTVDELDLTGATARRVAFPGSTVKSLDVTQASLQDFDLRQLELHAIAGLEGLRGATLSDVQVAQLAASFAVHLGIRVG